MIDEFEDMKPRVVFAHLCDYATLGNKGKPILVGIFDIIVHTDPAAPIRLPLSFFFLKLTTSLAAGTEHEVVIVVRHEDGKEVHRIDMGTISFQATGPGRPYIAQIVLGVAGMELPKIGDYSFQIIVDGKQAGEAPLYVVDGPAA